MEYPKPSTPFRIIGAVWVVAGGVTSAVTGPLNLENGSWAAAFAVLVAGVTQYAMGIVQSALASQHPSPRVVVAELVTWNAGCVAVILGTAAGLPLVVDVGGLLLVVALVLLVVTVRGRGSGSAWALWVYRILLVLMLVSIPIGLTLGHLRAG